MTKQLRAFRAGQDREIKRPWSRPGPVWVASRKLFRKEGGAWVEWWPLIPDPATNVTGVFSYRNDRIELDIDWDAPAGGPPVGRYDITVEIAGSFIHFTQPDNTTLSPDMAFHGLAGERATIAVTVVSPLGDAGETSYSVPIVIPQLPAPPDPTDLAVNIVELEAEVSWAHVGGNRLSGFELRTSYRDTTRESTATKAARSQNVTFWSTTPTPGDPGGVVGALIRAVGPGGYSSWVSVDGAVPDQPPPPAVILPGTPTLTNHRFLNGILRCTYSVDNAEGVRVWLLQEGKTTVEQASLVGPNGTIEIAGSGAWPRNDITRYRIGVRGYNADGQLGPVTYGAWAVKLPNPYYLRPRDFVSYRGAVRDKYRPLMLRQGSSYNTENYRNPIIQWRGYVMYPKDRLSGPRVGYSPTITSAKVLLSRPNFGGLGAAVRPRLSWHGYTDINSTGLALTGTSDLEGISRNQTKWVTVSTAFTRRLANHADPAIQGVAVYHPNRTLLSYLGEVSLEYMFFLGPFSTAFGLPMWTLSVHHDG